MSLFEDQSLSSKDGDENSNAVTSDSTKTYEDKNITGTDEKNGQQVIHRDPYSWLRDDCLEFYRNELLLTSSGSSSNSKALERPVIPVKERLSLLRVGIDKAMKVKKRFPNAQFLEFGVHEGKDLVRMADFLSSIEGKKSSKSQYTNISSKPFYTTFHGFDSFEGLPEDWINGQFGADDKPYHKQGAFDTGGESPDVDNLVNHRLKLGAHGRTNIAGTSLSSQSPALGTSKRVDNVEFHKGWFHESLPRFLDDHADTPIAFVHADADLYTSTLTFLRLICERRLFRKGSIIIFDEFWNYPNWENGEYKAWLEIVDEFGLETKYEYFGYHAPHPSVKQFKHYGYQSVGVVITSDLS